MCEKKQEKNNENATKKIMKTLGNQQKEVLVAFGESFRLTTEQANGKLLPHFSLAIPWQKGYMFFFVLKPFDFDSKLF